MKKITMFFAVLLSVMAANAQEFQLNDVGAYERKQVVEVEGVSASVLYDRAMIALSDYTGADGQSKVGIDYQNQETHTMIYKGSYFLSFKNIMLGAGWNRYADFTLKVRCKDGKAQLTIGISGITAYSNTKNLRRQMSMKEVLKNVESTTNEKKLETFKAMIDGANDIMSAMEARLKGPIDNDDDF